MANCEYTKDSCDCLKTIIDTYKSRVIELKQKVAKLTKKCDISSGPFDKSIGSIISKVTGQVEECFMDPVCKLQNCILWKVVDPVDIKSKLSAIL